MKTICKIEKYPDGSPGEWTGTFNNATQFSTMLYIRIRADEKDGWLKFGADSRTILFFCSSLNIFITIEWMVQFILNIFLCFSLIKNAPPLPFLPRFIALLSWSIFRVLLCFSLSSFDTHYSGKTSMSCGLKPQYNPNPNPRFTHLIVLLVD